MIGDFYRDYIVDLYKNPKNFGRFKKPDFSHEEKNPFCGDRIRIEVKNGDVKFSGEGCAISIASASMLTEKAKKMKIKDLKRLGRDDIVNMLGVRLTPTRLKCALLPLEVLQKAISKSEILNPVKFSSEP